jgi:hypothetical protein
VFTSVKNSYVINTKSKRSGRLKTEEKGEG